MRPGRFIRSKLLAALMLGLGAGIALGATSAAVQPRAGYSAPQLYNLANSYARDGKPGLAVLNYERARLIAPSDPDVQANLRYVRLAAGLPAVGAHWFDRYAGLVRWNIWFWLGCVGILLAGSSALALRTYPRHRIVLRVVGAAGLSGVILALCAAAALWPVMSEAVVIAPTTTQRVAPATVAEPLSTLHEAQIVTVEARRQDFDLVRTTGGHTGWVLDSDLAPIVPRGG